MSIAKFLSFIKGKKVMCRLIILVSFVILPLCVRWSFREPSIFVRPDDDEFMKLMEFRMQSRRNHIKQVCKDQGIQDNRASIRQNLLYSAEYKVLFCQIPKTGMTNWMKLFAEMDALPLKRFQITDKKRILKKTLQINDPAEIQEKLKSSEVKKLLVVREPFERLLSAFRDKLDNDPLPYYKKLSIRVQKLHGKNADGKFASFSDFVSFLVNTPALKSGDLHWRMYRHLCQPCDVDYDIIVHQETMAEDSRYFLKLVGAPGHLSLKSKYQYPTDNRIMFEYYSNVHPKENLYKLSHLLLDDYLLFNYSKPSTLS